jgi:D-sedoheptulose 7-phosphate isomerase
MTNARALPSAEFLSSLHRTLDEIDLGAVEAAARAITEAWGQDRRIFVLGNGGSAATASHLVCDLHGVARGRRGLGAFSLTDGPAVLTAAANDLGYERAFSEQVTNNARAGDVVILLSASGDSGNIVRAIGAARDAGARTIGILGFGGGRARALVDIAIVVSAAHFGVVESAHAAVVHLLAEIVREGGGPS